MPDITERGAPTIQSINLGHGVSWAAIFAGAAGAASLSLVLLLLGVGLGVSSVSPWTGAGLSAGALGASAIAWLAFTQLAASGMGGYLAGRLRSRWSSVHADEVYFRDTAHGFLAWGVATLLTAALLGGAVSAILGAGAQAASSAAGAAATVVATGAAGTAALTASTNPTQGSSAQSGMSYAVDALFRQDAGPASAPAGAASAPSLTTATVPPAPQASAPPLAEVGRIFSQAWQSDAQTLPQDDLRYVASLVASRVGVPQAEAEKRVSDAYAKLRARAAEMETKAREAADAARKATAHASIWMVVALLVGAFVASFAATIGGRRRDI